jgi:hypothetical protein
MKKIGLMLLIPLCANAQINGMSQADIERMMQGAKQMQSCLSGIDQRALNALASEGEALEKQVAGLCRAGKQDEAESKAIAFARRLQGDPQISQLRNCGEQAMALMPSLPFADIDDPMDSEAERLCDRY